MARNWRDNPIVRLVRGGVDTVRLGGIEGWMLGFTLGIIGLSLVMDGAGGHWLDVALFTAATAPCWLALAMSARLWTRLDVRTANALHRLLSTRCDESPLLDKDAAQLLFIDRCHGGWHVERFDVDATDDAMTDFNLGQTVSTIPYTRYGIRGNGRVASVDRALTVQQTDDGMEEVDQTPPTRRQIRQTLLFDLRTGTFRPTHQEVSELVTQLQRAEPVPREAEDGEAAT